MRNWITRATVIVMIVALALVGGLVVSSPSKGEASGGTTGEMQTALNLTAEEKATVMNIIESDAHVGGILQKGDWHVQLIGTWTEDQQKIGANVLIIFDGAVWIEDTFYDSPSGSSYAAKLWVGSMHILVDLRDGKIVGLIPNIGTAPTTSPPTSPITSKEHAAAVKIALSHPLAKALGENIEVYLNAVYYTDDYPQGIAFFNMRSDQGEAFVAIDLDKMVVVEQYTGMVIS